MKLVLEFLVEYQNHRESLLTDGDPLRRYISERASDELAKWDILLVSLRRDANVTDTSLGIPIRCQQRAEGNRSNSKTLLVSNRHRVSSRGIEKTGLKAEQIELAEKNYLGGINNDGEITRGRRISYPDRIYREFRNRPLLMIHLLEITDQKRGPETSQPVVAWGISFPRTAKQEVRVQYVVNSTWMQENFGDDDDDDDAGGDDN